MLICMQSIEPTAHALKKAHLISFWEGSGGIILLKILFPPCCPHVLNDIPQVSNVFHKGVPNSITLLSHKSNNLNFQNISNINIIIPTTNPLYFLCVTDNMQCVFGQFCDVARVAMIQRKILLNLATS